jgi:hypothetical protein
MTKSWIDPYNRTAVTQNWPAGVPLRDIFSPALPLFPYSLVGEREEKRWELRKRDQHENLEVYPAM